MSDEATTYDVLHNGGNQFTVADDANIYRVDLDVETAASMVTTVGQGNDVSEDDKRAILRAVVREGPAFRETMGDRMNITLETPAPGNASGTAQSGGSGGSDQSGEGEDAGISSTITVEHDHDLGALEDELHSWLVKASGFKGDINPEWVSIEQAQATIPGGYDDPDAGQTVVGFQLDTAPWYTGNWDRDDGWDSAEAEDKFSAHRESLTGEGGVFRTTEQVLGIQDDDGYYDNFVPADRVGDL